jgi:hypothetical protein
MTMTCLMGVVVVDVVVAGGAVKAGVARLQPRIAAAIAATGFNRAKG